MAAHHIQGIGKSTILVLVSQYSEHHQNGVKLLAQIQRADIPQNELWTSRVTG
jgi:hypothetical protein